MLLPKLHRTHLLLVCYEIKVWFERTQSSPFCKLRSKMFASRFYQYKQNALECIFMVGSGKHWKLWSNLKSLFTMSRNKMLVLWTRLVVLFFFISVLNLLLGINKFWVDINFDELIWSRIILGLAARWAIFNSLRKWWTESASKRH